MHIVRSAGACTVLSHGHTEVSPREQASFIYLFSTVSTWTEPGSGPPMVAIVSCSVHDNLLLLLLSSSLPAGRMVSLCGEQRAPFVFFEELGPTGRLVDSASCHPDRCPGRARGPDLVLVP